MAKYPYEIEVGEIVIKYSFPSDLPEIARTLLSLSKELGVNFDSLKSRLDIKDGEYGGIKVVRRKIKKCQHVWTFKHEGIEQCDKCLETRDIHADQCQFGGDIKDCKSCCDFENCKDRKENE